jgi:hypothetical protein
VSDAFAGAAVGGFVGALAAYAIVLLWVWLEDRSVR